MNKTRLEAFSDGVLAIIITIMVLEFKVPENTSYEAIMPLLHKFLSYILSFVYVGIYWNNHHHMMQTITQVNGKILWANLHLLFWLSLIPFATAWIGEHHFAPFPMMFYGFILLMNAITFLILQNVILKNHDENSILAKALGKNRKGIISPILYSIGIVFAPFYPVISGILYIFVALMWLIPDNRIERIYNNQNQ